MLWGLEDTFSNQIVTDALDYLLFACMENVLTFVNGRYWRFAEQFRVRCDFFFLNYSQQVAARVTCHRDWCCYLNV